jgi:two-component system NtrC family sensor kinase
MRLAAYFSRKIRDASIRVKLVSIIAITCGAGILAAGIAVFAFQIYTLRATFARDIIALSTIVADDLSGPVAFNDQKTALEVLGSLKAKPQIDSGIVTTPDGVVIAQSGKPTAWFDPSAPPVRFLRWDLQVISPVNIGNDTVGYLQLEADFRPTFSNALRAFLAFILCIGLAAFAVAMAVGYRLQGLIIEPLQRLSAAATVIGTKRDFRVRVEKLGHDELGTLTDAFNHMLAQLQSADTELRRTNLSLSTEINERKRLQSELLEASRLAGMADVATGVLHNVGNVLNSINVSTGTMREQLRTSRVSLLSDTANLIRTNESNLGTFFQQDDRGRRVPAFLTRLSEQLVSEQSRFGTELDGLALNIEHIKEIVAMQQNYAKASAVIEQVDAAQLMEHALSIHRMSIERHRVIVQRDFPPGPQEIATDRHKILQILTNFVANAVQATKSNPAEGRSILVSVSSFDPSHLAFAVRDNGVGIPGENLSKLFQQGFTTRKNGHGFGLHSGALIARSLGGTIDVDSAGLGTGATFTLRLPVIAPANAKSIS